MFGATLHPSSSTPFRHSSVKGCGEAGALRVEPPGSCSVPGEESESWRTEHTACVLGLSSSRLFYLSQACVDSVADSRGVHSLRTALPLSRLCPLPSLDEGNGERFWRCSSSGTCLPGGAGLGLYNHKETQTSKPKFLVGHNLLRRCLQQKQSHDLTLD